MDGSMQKSTQYLIEVEELAQNVLTDKDAKLELSNACNKYREAYRALQQTGSKKTWLKCGLVYMEMPVDDCKGFLKNGMDKTADEINKLNDTIKQNLSKLRDLEHEPGIVGIGLKPMSISETKALHKAFGY